MFKNQASFKKIFFTFFISSAFLFGCTDRASTPDFYYIVIQGLNLRIPGKFGPISVTRDTSIQDRCKHNFSTCLEKVPGAPAESVFFIEQDFKTFERNRPPKDFKGLSDNLKLWVSSYNKYSQSPRLPNLTQTWNDSNRASTNKLYGLTEYKTINGDDANYLYRFDDGTTLYMTCKHFNLPNPGCSVTTTWRGLWLNYDFRHHHLAEWRNINQRLIEHLASFLY